MVMGENRWSSRNLEIRGHGGRDLVSPVLATEIRVVTSLDYMHQIASDQNARRSVSLPTPPLSTPSSDGLLPIPP
ncbi:hypothetical protein NL676_021352 [Syzygium grande]|nr:hypothetical protein NL676_021352 [Syzygium grande]